MDAKNIMKNNLYCIFLDWLLPAKGATYDGGQCIKKDLGRIFRYKKSEFNLLQNFRCVNV
ncbi:hypothetical protein BS614_02545 [Paenibacillus xylanexedens]|nr:hypothetical protein BS614_02545 [Paenibacillus xylanexedens]